MVEQRRFDKHSAYLAKELERMKQLQEQYLFLVNNDIKTLEGLVVYKVLKELDVEKISERQQNLYQQNRARKRVCKTEADIRNFQIWHMGVQKELDELKAEKKAISQNLKIADGCLEEYKKFSMLDYSTIEDEIHHLIEVPEYPYAVYEKKTKSACEDVSVSVAEELVDVDVVDELGVAVVETDDVTDKREALSVADKVSEKCPEEKIISYEEYKKMTPLEKAQICGFNQIRSRQMVQNIVKQKFMDMEPANMDELLEETKRLGVPFEYWSTIQKAEALQFKLDNNAYNVKLYLTVCKACGVDTSDEDKVFADYQAVYEKAVAEQRYERRDGGRGRAR